MIKKYSSKLGLENYPSFIRDSELSPEYLYVADFKDIYPGGKTVFYLGGTKYLQPNEDILIEILDSDGNPVYYEVGKGSPDYYEGYLIPISLTIYPDTSPGNASITILAKLKTWNDSGTIQDIPELWKDQYNLKWHRRFHISPNRENGSDTILRKYPKLSYEYITQPLYSNRFTLTSGSGYSNGYLDSRNQLIIQKLQGNYPEFTSQMVGSDISIPSLNYTGQIQDVISNKEVSVTPISKLFTQFTSQSFQVTWLSGSEATTPATIANYLPKIELEDLDTFSGKLDGIKVYRKSRSTVGDFTLVGHIGYNWRDNEFSNLLYNSGSSSEIGIPYGNFPSEEVANNFWNFNGPLSNVTTGSIPDSELLINSIAISSSVTPVTFVTDEYYDKLNNKEWELSFYVRRRYPERGGYIRAYITGSETSMVKETEILRVSNENGYFYERGLIKKTFYVSDITEPRLGFEVSGSWNIGGISILPYSDKNISPHTAVFIDTSGRDLPTETFDYRFVLLDGSGNEIPIGLELPIIFESASFSGNGGSIFRFVASTDYFYINNDFGTSSLLPPTEIDIKIQSFVGPDLVQIQSGAYDRNGDFISASVYGESGQYPGLLDGIGTKVLTLSYSNFTGSNPDIDVQYIFYEASIIGIDSVYDRFTISKVLNGEPGKSVSLTSTTQTIIYDGSSTKINPVEPVTLKATGFNIGDDTLYYQFFKDGLAITGISSTSNQRVLSTGELPLPGEYSQYSVELRYGSSTNPVVAKAEITIFGIKNGTDPYIASLSTPIKVLQWDGQSYVNLSESGTDILAYRGTSELNAVTNFTLAPINPVTGLRGPSYNEYSASIIDSSEFITPGTLQIISEETILYSISNISSWNNPQSNQEGYITYRVFFENIDTQDLTQRFTLVTSGSGLITGSNGVSSSISNGIPTVSLGGEIDDYTTIGIGTSTLKLDPDNSAFVLTDQGGVDNLSVNRYHGSQHVTMSADLIHLDSNTSINLTASSIEFYGYGLGDREPTDYGVTYPNYIIGVSPDGGKLVDLPINSLVGSGTSGTSGTSGVSGTSGTSGTRGTSGTSGTRGTSGTSGTAGTTGSPGTSGTSGQDGTFAGSSGTSGTSGVDGTGAVSSLDDLTDVTITGTPNSGDILKYNSISQVWENSPNAGVTSVSASNGLNVSEEGNNYTVKLSGSLNQTTEIDLNNNYFSIYQNNLALGIRISYLAKVIELDTGTSGIGHISTNSYGFGNKQTGSFTPVPKVNSGYLAGFSTDGTLVEIPISDILSAGGGTSGTSGTRGTSGTSGVDGTSGTSPTIGSITLDNLSDVTIIGSPSQNQVLKYNGTNWVNAVENQQVTGSNGLTTTQNGSNYTIKLGGNLTENTVIDGTTNSISIESDTQVRLYSSANSSITLNNISTSLRGILLHTGSYVAFQNYGDGVQTDSNLSVTDSGYIAGFATNGTLIEIDSSTLGGGGTGTSGTSGTSGTNGASGTSGTSGQDGTFFGTSGTSGLTAGESYPYYITNISSNSTINLGTGAQPGEGGRIERVVSSGAFTVTFGGNVFDIDGTANPTFQFAGAGSAAFWFKYDLLNYSFFNAPATIVSVYAYPSQVTRV